MLHAPENVDYYRILLYIIFGVLPSLIWLFYYLRKDLHPEPKRMIIKIFLLGCLVTVPVYFFQVAITRILTQLQIFPFLTQYQSVFDVLQWFVAIAFIEELFKFLVVKMSVFNSGHLDEPVDLMIYMVVVALGFAAVENILYLLAPLNNISFNDIIQTTIIISLIRFVGATFLHTLCSSLLGYYLVMGTLKNKRNILFLALGLFLASAFHGLYDFSITLLPNPFSLLIPMTIIIVLFLIMIHNFNKVKKLKSVCKI